jgi:hypothetical protein
VGYALLRIPHSYFELGHYEIGKELESTANALGYQTLDEYRAKEKQYDTSTAHGKSQGAWLEK